MANLVNLLWFRNNLRLQDNAALHAAMDNNASLIPVYIFDPRHYRELDMGFRKADIKRFDFLKSTLINLNERLVERGSYLIIKTGKPEEIIPEISKKFGVQTVYASEEIGSEEAKVDNELGLGLGKYKIGLKLIWDRTLYHIADAPFSIKDAPDVSKPFRLKLTKETDVRKEIIAPKKILSPSGNGAKKFSLPSAEELGYGSGSDKTEFNLLVPAGEEAASKRLDYFTFDSELLTRYKWLRNKSLGLDYSSKLSPYLAVGAISPRTIYFKVKKYEDSIKKNISTWWLIFELVWRDYFAYMALKHGNEIFKIGGYKTRENTDFSTDKALFERWKYGNTGIPFIDAHMRELIKTGYMSNRGRVNCASFLTRDYKVNWTWGAAWFESHLIDYDVSSNWLNWNVQALEIYHTNALWQGLKYDKEGEYVKSFIPELAAINSPFVQAPWLSDEQPKDYPKPQVDLKGWDWAIKRVKKAFEKYKSQATIESNGS